MLFVPIAARISRCIAQQSSFVAREDARPAIASAPCAARIRPSSLAIRASASSQLAARKPPSSRISGRAQALARARELVGEAALEARVPAVGGAVGRRG